MNIPNMTIQVVLFILRHTSDRMHYLMVRRIVMHETARTFLSVIRETRGMPTHEVLTSAFSAVKMNEIHSLSDFIALLSEDDAKVIFSLSLKMAKAEHLHRFERVSLTLLHILPQSRRDEIMGDFCETAHSLRSGHRNVNTIRLVLACKLMLYVWAAARLRLSDLLPSGQKIRGS